MDAIFKGLDIIAGPATPKWLGYAGRIFHLVQRAQGKAYTYFISLLLPRLDQKRDKEFMALQNTVNKVKLFKGI